MSLYKTHLLQPNLANNSDVACICLGLLSLQGCSDLINLA